MNGTTGTPPTQREPALAAHSTSNTPLTGANFDTDGGQQLVIARAVG